MTVQVLGELPLATLNPGLVGAAAGLTGSASALLPQLTTHLAGCIVASAQIALFPPVLAVQLTEAIAAVASITLAISVGVPPVDVQLVAIATGLVDVLAQIATLEGFASVVAEVNAALGASVAAYVYEGPANGLGEALRRVTSGGVQGAPAGAATTALVMASTIPADIGALLDIFGITSYDTGSMTLLGERTLGSLNPILSGVVADLSGNLSANLPSLYAQVDGMLAAQLSLTLVPPTPITQLAFATSLIATITGAISAGIPSGTAQFDALGNVIIEITDLVAKLEAQVDFVTSLGSTLAASVAAFFFDGKARNLGSEIGAETSGGITGGAPGDSCTALVFATSQPLSATAMSALFGVSA